MSVCATHLCSCLSLTREANYNQDKLDEFIDVININLQPMFMHIRKGMSEEDGLQYYALVGDVNMNMCAVFSMCADFATERFWSQISWLLSLRSI